jgi:hypothetical protein
MALLSEYTLSLLDNDKVVVDFADTVPSHYEKMEFLKFFRKYKQDVFVEFEGKNIFFIVLPWHHWVEFLLSFGFRDTAKATTEVLNDLDIDRTPSVDEYISQLKKAKIIRTIDKSVVEDDNRGNWEFLKEKEIERLTRKENKEKKQKEEECDEEKKDY